MLRYNGLPRLPKTKIHTDRLVIATHVWLVAWLNLLELAIFFAESVQIYGSPKTSSLAANHYDGRAVDGQEDGRTGAALDRMLDSFVHVLLFAAVLAQAHQSAAHQTQAGLLGHRIAVPARFVMVILKRRRDETRLIGKRLKKNTKKGENLWVI